MGQRVQRDVRPMTLELFQDTLQDHSLTEAHLPGVGGCGSLGIRLSGNPLLSSVVLITPRPINAFLNDSEEYIDRTLLGEVDGLFLLLDRLIPLDNSITWCCPIVS